MKKINRINKFVLLTVILAMCLSTTAFASERNDFRDRESSSISVINIDGELLSIQQLNGWVRSNKVNYNYRYQTIQTNQSERVTDEETLETTCKQSELASVEASIKAGFGYVEGSLHATATSSTELTYKITYRHTISKVITYDVRKVYKRSYYEARYYKNGKYAYFIKETYVRTEKFNIRKTA